MAERHQVVIIGGGFGGLNAARGLTGPHLDVTLVDRTNHHLFQPLLYQVAAGILPPGLIAPALRSAVRSASNVRTLLADVHDIDLDAKTVHARAGRPSDRPALRQPRRGGRGHPLVLRQGPLRRVRAGDEDH